MNIMNPQVQEFINRMKEEKQLQEKTTKDELLISLGLIDESKTVIKRLYEGVYSFTTGCLFDDEKQQYYIQQETYYPIEVTDEEYQEILKYSNVATNKANKENKKEKTSWSLVISFVSKVFAVVTILFGVIFSIVFRWELDEFVLIPIVVSVINCLLIYPLMMGFSKVVEVAEKKLAENKI
jgi:ATP-dependent Zn protease